MMPESGNEFDGGGDVERDPYAPPKERGEESAVVPVPASGDPRVVDKVLRGVGAMCVGFLLIRALRMQVADGRDVFEMVATLGIVGMMVHGFLRGGRRWHLGIGVLMMLGLSSQVYFFSELWGRFGRMDMRVLPVAWWRWVLGCMPQVAALGCAVGLYVRGRGRSAG
ncbi:hypothetical protein [Luteolibacter soli]|uniref:Uncharacterized protein n=1 Tax=Luteolibacter soli TaxID=3135280 RepID=A0ABU9AVT2_9BACT